MSRSREDGAATPLVLGAVAALLVATLGALAVVGAVVASHRARSAADLAALAAARVLALGGSGHSACAEAVRVVRANGASLEECAPRAAEVVVLASVDVAGWPEDAVARSRAGPSRDADRPHP